MTRNSIYLSKRNKVIAPTKGKNNNKVLVAAMLQNFKDLGYTFSLALAERLITLTSSQLGEFYNTLIKELRESIGAHRAFNPMYPNFPEEIELKDATTLLWDALTYEDNNFQLPELEILLRPTINELAKLVVLEIGSEADFKTIFSNLLSAKTSISQSDKDIIKWFLNNYTAIYKTLLPETIPLKENVAFLIGEVLLLTGNTDGIEKYLKTPTDILRLCTVISKGDVSLAQPTKFKNMSRPFRRGILRILNSQKSLAEEMVKYRENWKRLGEKLHPREFHIKYPKAVEAFTQLRSGNKIETFHSAVEAAIKTGDLEKTVKLLKTRPGEFARRLDKLFRGVNDWERIIVAEEFLEVAEQVALPVLLQVHAHFKNRAAKKDRAIFPKGSIAKMQIINMPKEQLPEEFTEAFARDIKKEIIKILAKREPLGGVYIDPAVNNLIVPFAERSASKALKTLVRGSRIALEGDLDTIRFFLWWKQAKSKTEDIDLSAGILNAEWKYIQDLSYYNLVGDMGCHSGDIRSAPNGAAEFIDVSLKKTEEIGGRYIVMSVFSYTGTPLVELPECFGGWMMRKTPRSGEIYDPTTVKNKIDIAATTRACIPVIIDVIDREIIWVDMPINAAIAGNTKNTAEKIGKIGKALANNSKPNLGDLFEMHVAARGTKTDRGTANVVIAADGDVNPFEQDKIIANWL